jgi:hypothetical protein
MAPVDSCSDFALIDRKSLVLIECAYLNSCRHLRGELL